MTDTQSPKTSKNNDLELAGLLRRAWDIFRQQPGALIVGFLVTMLGGTLSLGFALGPLMVGYIRVLDRASRGEEIAASEVFDGMSTFWPALAVALITTAVVLLGSLFVVLPGVAIAVIWSFGLWFLALADHSPVDALGASSRLVRSHLGTVLLLLLAIVLLNFIGSLIVVGALVTGPVTLLVATMAFRELTPS